MFRPYEGVDEAITQLARLGMLPASMNEAASPVVASHNEESELPAFSETVPPPPPTEPLLPFIKSGTTSVQL